MARNNTSSGDMKLKLCTGILNGSEGHLRKFGGVSTIWTRITGEKGVFLKCNNSLHGHFFEAMVLKLCTGYLVYITECV